MAALLEVAQAHQHGSKEVGGEEHQEVHEVDKELRVDREAQAPLVGDDEGDDGLENSGEERVDAEDQGTELLRKRSRDLKRAESRSGWEDAASRSCGRPGPGPRP